MMPAMLAQYFNPPAEAQAPAATAGCPECGGETPPNARFCPRCGHQLLIFRQCVGCGKNLTPAARFCPRCGQPAEKPPAARNCRRCGAENLNEATFCNACGEKL
jgi:predicted amidophosphoribosyltransferase